MAPWFVKALPAHAAPNGPLPGRPGAAAEAS